MWGAFTYIVYSPRNQINSTSATTTMMFNPIKHLKPNSLSKIALINLNIPNNKFKKRTPPIPRTKVTFSILTSTFSIISTPLPRKDKPPVKASITDAKILRMAIYSFCTFLSFFEAFSAFCSACCTTFFAWVIPNFAWLTAFFALVTSCFAKSTSCFTWAISCFTSSVEWSNLFIRDVISFII